MHALVGDVGCTIRVGASRLDAPGAGVDANGGTLKCVGAYEGDYDALAANCL